MRTTTTFSQASVAPETIARFRDQLKHVKKTAGGCWLWPDIPPTQYATVYDRKRREGVGAHRLSFIVHHGPLKPGLFVCHRCDTPACVAPAHLFAGTHADNMKDKGAKGRVVIGKRDPIDPRNVVTGVHARFFSDDVALIKKIAAEKCIPWQIELRLTVRRALKGERQEFLVLKDQP